MADCLSTAMFVLGEVQSLNYWRTYGKTDGGGFDMVLITKDNRIICTKGLIEDFTLVNDNYTVVLQPVDYASSCTDFTTQLGCAKSYKPKDGYRIRLANPAKVLVNQGSKTVYSIEMAPIYQLGKIETLSRGHDELDIEKFGLIY